MFGVVDGQHSWFLAKCWMKMNLKKCLRLDRLIFSTLVK